MRCATFLALLFWAVSTFGEEPPLSAIEIEDGKAAKLQAIKELAAEISVLEERKRWAKGLPAKNEVAFSIRLKKSELSDLRKRTAEDFARLERWYRQKDAEKRQENAAKREHEITQLAQRKGALNLDDLKSLSDAIARALANHEGELFLRGVSTLSDKATESLAEHKGDLWLSGMTALSDKQAEALAKNKGGLSLNGLRSLSDKSAESLAKHKGWLNLDGLPFLGEQVARTLAPHKGSLSLKGWRSISDDAAEALGKHKGDLGLDGLTALSDKAAEALAKHDGGLSLSRVKAISEKAAAALANHNAMLNLSGLDTLSPEAAEALSKHKGDLVLTGLRKLSREAAEALTEHGGVVYFGGAFSFLERSEAASILREHAEKHREAWRRDGNFQPGPWTTRWMKTCPIHGKVGWVETVNDEELGNTRTGPCFKYLWKDDRKCELYCTHRKMLEYRVIQWPDGITTLESKP